MAGLSACAGNGQGLDSSGRPLGESGGVVPLGADFDAIQQNVFTPICTACHAGASAPVGLRLDAGNSYSLLVGVASGESPGTLRVKPGDPDNSYIIQKLEGHAAVGAQMPLGGPPLPVTTIAFIRQWITNGAPRGTVVANAVAGTEAMNSFVLTGSAPMAGEFVEVAPAAVVLSVSQDLDVTRVDTVSVQLQREIVVADGAAPIWQGVPATVQVPAGNLRAIVVTPQQQPLPAGQYRVVLNGLSGNDVTDLAGEPIAGVAVAPDGSRNALTFTVGGVP
jgi:hypothetical protein